ncbi:MAG: glycoside hydrolase family 3 C-terminal domain-containing protein, partial [Prevotella sp.]|nr:glycoside hydrolase family 3 C-terminal domain-containing protein [Prevotella sp.]
DMDCGEGYDRATLGLLGRQQQLLEALKATEKPLVVVYIEGRPLNKNWSAEHANALLTAYYPGQEGGMAIADVLFGDYNPAGRIPVSVPRDVGQLPVYYNQKYPEERDYMDMTARPLYAFGYGLSYTTFAYSHLSVERHSDGCVEVSFDITNTGNRDGEEVPQLYLRDEVASTVQPRLQLKRFDRVLIRKGETRRITFTLVPDDFSIINRQMQRVVEPGTFLLMVGPSSDHILLQETIQLTS